MNEFGLSFHHLILGVREFRLARLMLDGMGYRIDVKPFRVNNDIHCFSGRHEQMPGVEVIWAADNRGPVSTALETAQQQASWHVCYASEDVNASIRALAKAGLNAWRVAAESAASSFAGAMSFYIIEGIGLIAVLDGAPHKSEGPLAAGIEVERVAALEASIAVATEAERVNDSATALAAWEYVRACFPTESRAYSAAAMLLRKLDRPLEADVLVNDGILRFPNDEKICELHAWMAHGSGDIVRADKCWTDFRIKFPRAFAGYYGGGAIKRARASYEEADAIYETAIHVWPNAHNLLTDYAAVALSRGDVEEASMRWAAVRVKFADRPDGFLHEGRSLRVAGVFDKADAILEEGIRRFPSDVEMRTEYAHVAHQRGDSRESLRRWSVVIDECHGVSEGYVGAARVLVDLGRFAEAQNVLAPAVRVFPQSLNVLELNATLAHLRQDFVEALVFWRALREHHPNYSGGYVGAINSLLAYSSIDEAEIIAAEAIRRFPADMNIASMWARIPQHLQNWDSSLDRWRSLSDRFPSPQIIIQCGSAQMLAKLERWDEADALLEETILVGGNDLSALRIYAECATERRNFELAETRWRNLIASYPANSAGWIGLGEMFRQAGQMDDAHRTLVDGSIRFPADFDLELHLARIETIRREWQSALRRWEDLKRGFSDRPAVVNGIKEALAHARADLALAASEGQPPPFEISAFLSDHEHKSAELSTDLCQLFMKFESIGDTCEFGMVQRRFGAEPISLLRWTSTPPEHLVALLNTRFAGVGEAEFTVVSEQNGEYSTQDKRYYMFSHTFTSGTQAGLDKFAAQHLRRMRYLKARLIDDLRLGEKIFVYKCEKGLTDDMVRSIYDGIRSYGPHTALLCVRLAQHDKSPGTIETLADGLFVAYIDRFSTVDINVDAWIKICTTTDSQWRPMTKVLSVA